MKKNQDEEFFPIRTTTVLGTTYPLISKKESPIMFDKSSILAQSDSNGSVYNHLQTVQAVYNKKVIDYKTK